MHNMNVRRSLLIRKLGAETLVYDLESFRASCLNREAAAVFEACDGKRSKPEIRARVSDRLGSEVDDAYVELAIDRLARQGLVEPLGAPLSKERREVLRRLAAAVAVALPVVTSVLAPSVAEAQSCLPNGTVCTGNAQCCSKMCQASMGNGKCKG